MTGVTTQLLGPLLGAPQVIAPCELHSISSSLPFGFLSSPTLGEPSLPYVSQDSHHIVAQYPYRSNISHQLEYHAIHATLIGANGSDTMLVKLLQATFEQAQWRTKLDKGRFVFPPNRRAKI